MKPGKPNRKAEEAAWYAAQDEKSLLYLIYRTQEESGRSLRTIATGVTIWMVLVGLGLVAGCLYAVLLQ